MFFENEFILKKFNNEYFSKNYKGTKFDILTEKDEPNEKSSKVSNATHQG